MPVQSMYDTEESQHAFGGISYMEEHEVPRHFRRVHADLLVRDKIGSLAADLEAARLLAANSISLVERGQVPYHQAAITKVFSSELEERLPEVVMELLGTAATLSADAPGALLDGTFEYALRDSIYKVIGGGSNEIQRTLIATRGLGLPR